MAPAPAKDSRASETQASKDCGDSAERPPFPTNLFDYAKLESNAEEFESFAAAGVAVSNFRPPPPISMNSDSVNLTMRSLSSSDATMSTWQKLEAEKKRKSSIDSASQVMYDPPALRSNSPLHPHPPTTTLTLSGRTINIPARTTDNVVVAGSAARPQGSMGAQGMFQAISPYPSALSVDPAPGNQATKSKILCCSGAAQFPGLLATGGHDKSVKLWIHRPLEEDVAKKPDAPSKSGFGGLFGRKKESGDNAAQGGFWENFGSVAGPRDWVNCLQFSEDASLLLAGSRAGSLHMWKAPRMGPLAGEWESISCVNRAHAGDEFNTGVINAVAMHPDNDRCMSGSSDWEVKVWDVETGAGLTNGQVCGSSSSRHTAAVRDINVCKFNGVFATSGDDGAVLVWDSRSREHGSAVAKMQVRRTSTTQLVLGSLCWEACVGQLVLGSL